MILISHRGNLNGPNVSLENTPVYIDAAIDAGYECEVDLRVIDGKLFLGHDTPTNEITTKWLRRKKAHLYIHAKTKETVEWLLTNGAFNFFFHDKDEFTFTSENKLWCFPSKQPITFGINLMPELNGLEPESLSGCLGICSDNISKYCSQTYYRCKWETNASGCRRKSRH